MSFEVMGLEVVCCEGLRAGDYSTPGAAKQALCHDMRHVKNTRTHTHTHTHTHMCTQASWVLLCTGDRDAGGFKKANGLLSCDATSA